MFALYIGCSDVTKFDSIYGRSSGRHVVRHSNRNIIVMEYVCGLSDTDLQRYIDNFKSLRIDKCPCEIMRTGRTDDSFALQNGVDNMTIESY